MGDEENKGACELCAKIQEDKDYYVIGNIIGASDGWRVLVKSRREPGVWYEEHVVCFAEVHHRLQKTSLDDVECETRITPFTAGEHPFSLIQPRFWLDREVMAILAPRQDYEFSEDGSDAYPFLSYKTANNKED